jgi:hypothetical protein
VWVTALPAISGRSEEKLAAAATTRMLCDLPALQVGCPVALAASRNFYASPAYDCRLQGYSAAAS